MTIQNVVHWASDRRAMLFSLVAGLIVEWPSSHTTFFWRQACYSFLPCDNQAESLVVYNTQIWIFFTVAAFGLFIFPVATSLLSRSGFSWWFSFPILIWLAGSVKELPWIWKQSIRAERKEVLFVYWLCAMLLNLAIAAALRRRRRLKSERLLLSQSPSQEVIEGVWPPPPQLK